MKNESTLIGLRGLDFWGFYIKNYKKCCAGKKLFDVQYTAVQRFGVDKTY